jgi:hypothetical protein
MTLTYKSSIPESFVLVGREPDGRERRVVATKESGAFNWNLRLQHPSGESWPGTYHGPNGILDAMAELMRSKDSEFKQDKARGDRPRQPAFDPNRSIDGYAPPIVPHNGRR